MTAKKWRDRVNWKHVPEHMREGIAQYIERGVTPGGFLQAVIRNDLRDACMRADDINQEKLWYIVRFFAAFAPPACWGSAEALRQWNEIGGLAGQEAHDDESVDG